VSASDVDAFVDQTALVFVTDRAYAPNLGNELRRDAELGLGLTALEAHDVAQLGGLRRERS
jgi:hypothetical protein